MVVKYFIHEKSKNDMVNIYVRFIDSRRFDEKTKTGLFIPKEFWSTTKGKIKPNSIFNQREFVNQHLNGLRLFILEQYNLAYNSKQYIPKKWLKNQVEYYFGRVDGEKTHLVYFMDWLKLFLNNIHTLLNKDGSNTIAFSTQKQYKSISKKLFEFEAFQQKKYRFEEIDLQFYRKLIVYLREERKLNNNSIGTVISKMKLFCKYAEIENLPINPLYKTFTAPSNKTYDTYLNEEEIDLIFNYNFSNSSRLDNARDLFIMGLRTGLRISDFLRLKDLNIKEGYIEIITSKTSEQVIIPMHDQIEFILNKRNGALPYKISDQKFNLYIKEICKLVGITSLTKGSKISKETRRKQEGMYPKYELISSHTCRRSFASNLYGKLPNMVIMSITGHKTEAQFLKYIKITKQEHAKTLKEYWVKQKKENRYENVTMKVVN